jgi:hypothetical protein
MVRPTAPGTAVDRLVRALLDRDPLDHDDGDPMAEELAGWLAGSPRFRAFVQAHHYKIRKKLRGAVDPEARRDVRAELRVAHLLLADRRIGLAFEAYGSRRIGPDFTLTFRENQQFNLEVTRLRGAPTAAGLSGHLLAKLRQLPPSVPNALLVAIDTESAQAVDVAAAIRWARARADKKDETFFATRGFDSARAFYERFLRLGAVFVWCEAAAGDGRAALWTNRSARMALLQRAARACLAGLRAD